MKKFKLWAMLPAMALAVSAFAQNSSSHTVTFGLLKLADIRVVDGSNNTNPNINFATAGDLLTGFGSMPAANTDLLLQYISIPTYGNTNAISVTSDMASVNATLASNSYLEVTAAAFNGTAAWYTTNLGTTSGAKTIPEDNITNENVVTGIGASWTGITAGKGIPLTYEWKLELGKVVGDVSGLSGVVTITYTISEN